MKSDLGHRTGLGPVVHVEPAAPDASIILVCEHGSARIPDALAGLGLSPELLQSHIAWDPGALGVAHGLARRFAAPLVHGGISRLVYDCNRPPESPDAIPAHSEIHGVPGNLGLDAAARRERVDEIYWPFTNRLAAEIRTRRAALELMVTVHSFTPVYRGRRRDVEIGILHGKDARFAEQMVALAPAGQDHVVRLNKPYSAADGVAHTLDLHGAANRLPSVMLEIRNDLIATGAQQDDIADLMAKWIGQSLAAFREEAAG